MTTRLADILDAQVEAQQLPFSDVADLQATIEAEETNACEFEALCRQAAEERRKPGANRPKYQYRCGWQSTSIEWCRKRRRLLGGGDVPK